MAAVLATLGFNKFAEGETGEETPEEFGFLGEAGNFLSNITADDIISATETATNVAIGTVGAVAGARVGGGLARATGLQRTAAATSVAARSAAATRVVPRSVREAYQASTATAPNIAATTRAAGGSAVSIKDTSKFQRGHAWLTNAFQSIKDKSKSLLDDIVKWASKLPPALSRALMKTVNILAKWGIAFMLLGEIGFNIVDPRWIKDGCRKNRVWGAD